MNGKLNSHYARSNRAAASQLCAGNGQRKAAIQLNRYKHGVAMDTKEYVENLEAALIDVLDGNSSWWDIQYNTGLSAERCKEIESFFEKIVMPKYSKKHGL
jgi:hypothetical protein